MTSIKTNTTLQKKPANYAAEKEKSRMIKVIGISGKRGSGKTLLANTLAPYGYKRVSLAGLLKDKCKQDFGLTEEQVNGKFKEAPTQYIRTDGTPLTPRDVMIRMGIFYRSIDPLYWCKALEFQIKDTGANVVIDDIRFLNEVRYFKEHFGARFVRIERNPEDNPFKAALDDLSESELDTFKEWDSILLSDFNRNPRDLLTFSEYLVCHL
jgi:hypothetical protein